MEVAIWFSDPPFTGVGRYNRNLVEAIPEAIAFHYIPAKGIYEQPYVREQRIVGPFPLHLFANAELIFNRYLQPYVSKTRIMNRADIHMIHYTSQHESPFQSDSLLQMATIHDLTVMKEKPANFQDYMYRRIVKRNIEKILRLDHIVAISEVVKNEILESGYNGSVHVIHQCASNQFYHKGDKIMLRSKLGFPIDRFLILSVSSGAKRKNLAMITETMKLLDDRYALIRVGPALGARNEIQYMNVSDQVLNDIYNACDLLLFPSFDEGFGYPLVEAMATGLPVVASDIPTHREVLQNAAVLVNENKPESYIEAIKTVDENQNQFISACLLRSREFSLEKFANEYKSLYRHLLS